MCYRLAYIDLDFGEICMQQVLPGSFENEVAGWLANGGHNHTQIYDASAPLDHQLRYIAIKP